MELQATLLGRKCANILPSPPISPPTYVYPSAFGGRSWSSTTLASQQGLPTPSAKCSFSPTEISQQACNEKILALQEIPPHLEESGSPYLSSLYPRITVEKLKSVSSNIRGPNSTQPDLLQREHSRKERPARASSTASQIKPELLLAESEHQSDEEELFTGSEEECLACAPETIKSGVERLAEKRKMKRFRSVRTSSLSNGH